MGLATLVAACGTIDNSPLRIGVIRGQLQGADPSVATVVLMGDSQLRAGVDATGAFEIDNAPAGKGDLFIIASATRAHRLAVDVHGAQVTNLGLVIPPFGAFVEVRAGTRSRGSVSVGTPFAPTPLNSDGEARIGPLPAGCYGVTISVEGVTPTTRQLCLDAGKTAYVTLASPSCATCEEDVDCGAGYACDSEGDGVKVCLQRCDNGSTCESGFTCGGSGRCVPTHVTTCTGYWSFDISCTSGDDEFCIANGIDNGRCLNGHCTYPCASSLPNECPTDFQCSLAGFCVHR